MHINSSLGYLRPMFNFKAFRSACSVLAGIELMHMIRKGGVAIRTALGALIEFLSKICRRGA